MLEEYEMVNINGYILTESNQMWWDSGESETFTITREMFERFCRKRGYINQQNKGEVMTVVRAIPVIRKVLELFGPLVPEDLQDELAVVWKVLDKIDISILKKLVEADAIGAVMEILEMVDVNDLVEAKDDIISLLKGDEQRQPPEPDAEEDREPTEEEVKRDTLPEEDKAKVIPADPEVAEEDEDVDREATEEEEQRQQLSEEDKAKALGI